MLGGDSGEIGAVGGLLQPHELLHAFAFVGNPKRQPVQGLHVGIGLVGDDSPALVENTPQAAQHQQVAPGLLPVPGIDEHRTGTGDKPPFEPPPHAGGMRLVGHDIVDALREERLGLPGADQRLGKHVQRIGVEQGRQQPVESFIVTKDQHGVRTGSIGPHFYRIYAAAGR